MRHIISLGAGVQSSTMALMAAHGEIEPMPELAIFADTGWEPAAVYEWLAWLEQRLPFPVVKVSAGNIREDNVTARTLNGEREKGSRWASMPFFVATESFGMIRRQCTSEYKIGPIEKYQKREILGLRPRQRAPREPVLTQWIGISRDEASRMKPSRERWKTHRYPLAMELGMSRHDCLAWMERHGFPRPPRSACIGCPYRNNAGWRQMRDEQPEEWADAVEFDRQIRYVNGMKALSYIHNSRTPLDEVDLSTAEDRGQQDWINECEGMCGV